MSELMENIIVLCVSIAIIGGILFFASAKLLAVGWVLGMIAGFIIGNLKGRRKDSRHAS